MEKLEYFSDYCDATSTRIFSSPAIPDTSKAKNGGTGTLQSGETPATMEWEELKLGDILNFAGFSYVKEADDGQWRELFIP
jgi:hypothetical protein